MANVEMLRPGFEELCKQLRPIVFAAVPRTVSVGIVDEITEDVVYMMSRGKTLAMLGPDPVQVKLKDPTARKIGT